MMSSYLLRISSLFVFCLFSTNLYGSTPKNTPQKDPIKIGSSIYGDTQNALGSFGGYSPYTRERQSRSKAQEFLIWMQARRVFWDIQRKKLQYWIARATSWKKIRLILARAEADLWYARAQVEAYKTFFHEKKILRKPKVQTALRQAQAKLLISQSKLKWLQRMLQKEKADRTQSRSLRELEFCAQRSPSENTLKAGKAIEWAFIILKKALLYGKVCTDRTVHFFTQKDLMKIQFQLAITPPRNHQYGGYFSPLLALTPKFWEALAFLPEGKQKNKIRKSLQDLKFHIQSFYFFQEGDFFHRKHIAKKIKKVLESFLKTLFEKTPRSQKQSAFQTRMTQIRTQIEQLKEKLLFLDEEEDQSSIQEIQKKLQKLKRILKKVTQFLFQRNHAIKHMQSWLETFHRQVLWLTIVHPSFCHSLEGTYGATQKPPLWAQFRNEMLACLRIYQPRMVPFDSLNFLYHTPRARLCPSRNLLLHHLLVQSPNSCNGGCFSSSTKLTQRFSNLFSKMCLIYHNLESCGRSLGINFSPNVKKLFDHYEQDRKLYESYRKRLWFRPKKKSPSLPKRRKKEH